MDQQQIEAFLRRIGQIESSGGRNLNHKTMEHGMHKGDAALGTYGFMPNTIDEMLIRMKQENVLSPELAALKGKKGDELKQAYYSSPDIEKALANYMAKRVLERQGGDELKAAYSWYHGHNLSPDRITPDKIEQADYTKKYRKLLDKDSMDIKKKALQNIIYGPMPQEHMMASDQIEIPLEEQQVRPFHYLSNLFNYE